MFTQNSNLDARIIELKRQYIHIIQLLQTYQQQAQEFQEQLNAVEAEVRIVINSQTDIIAELECLSSSYSQDGMPICNLP